MYQAVYYLISNLSYFLKCNLEGKHYLAVIKISVIIKILTSSKCNFTSKNGNFLENSGINMVKTIWKIDFLLTISSRYIYIYIHIYIYLYRYRYIDIDIDI